MRKKSYLAVIIWLLLGVSIVLNQVSQPLALTRVKSDVEQSDNNKATNSSDEGFIIRVNPAINSFSQITLNQELYQIREIILDEVADPQHIHAVLEITEGDHFKTLFRKVISTNAP